jgi:hypothetical protein
MEAKTMNTKNHLKNAGSFKAGQVDKRRNDKGQMKAEAVALGALLKQYITNEGSKPAGPGKQTKAEALAAKIWERAMHGEFQFVQFLADRVMGKVKDELSLAHENLRFEYGGLSMADLKQSMSTLKEPPELTVKVVHVDDQGKQLYIEKPAMQP